MRPSAVLQHIQHIASLGLADAVAVPEMLATLELAVPAAYGSFYWIDHRGNTKDLYVSGDVLDQMAECDIDFRTLDPAREPTLDKVLAEGEMVDNASRIARRYDFSRSVVVNEVMPAMGVAMGLDMVVRSAGEARAVLYLNRETRAADYTALEKRLLAATHPYFSHAVTGAGSRRSQGIDPYTEREAVLLVGRDGQILSGAGDAIEILDELANPVAPALQRNLPNRLPPGLMPLLASLDAAEAGRRAPPARVILTGRRGEYRARAYPRERSAHGGFEAAAVIVSHHLPREAAMLRRVLALPLTPVERRVAVAVGEGRPSDEIAAQLGLTAQTLRGYLKAIYARTGAAGREQLAALMRGE